MSSKRFGNASNESISIAIDKCVPKNTLNTKKSIWKQFELFCDERQYSLVESSSAEDLGKILRDWAFNMKKVNGEDYKESVVKTIWNITAKALQEKYYSEFNRSFNPFVDIEFKSARDAKNAKRKQLQKLPEKRKRRSLALSKDDVHKMMKLWDDDTPKGLQMKFFHIASFDLAWRAGEGTYCRTHYFKYEQTPDGMCTNRIEYNPTFTNTCQEGGQTTVSSKWLSPNYEDLDVCPVRLFKKLIEKRSDNITSDRIFLTVNRTWDCKASVGWYKNMPVGINEIAKWPKHSAQRIGLDINSHKITYYVTQTSIVSNFVKDQIIEQQHNKLPVVKFEPDVEIHEEKISVTSGPMMSDECTFQNAVEQDILSNVATTTNVTIVKKEQEDNEIHEENVTATNSTILMSNDCTFQNAAAHFVKTEIDE